MRLFDLKSRSKLLAELSLLQMRIAAAYVDFGSEHLVWLSLQVSTSDGEDQLILAEASSSFEPSSHHCKSYFGNEIKNWVHLKATLHGVAVRTIELFKGAECKVDVTLALHSKGDEQKQKHVLVIEGAVVSGELVFQTDASKWQYLCGLN